jgi:hypothetical protein
MDRLYTLLEKSVLITGLISLMMVGTACYLWGMGTNVPQELYLSLGVILGFFFGAKTERSSGVRREGKKASEYPPNPNVGPTL